MHSLSTEVGRQRLLTPVNLGTVPFGSGLGTAPPPGERRHENVIQNQVKGGARSRKASIFVTNVFYPPDNAQTLGEFSSFAKRRKWLISYLPVLRRRWANGQR